MVRANVVLPVGEAPRNAMLVGRWSSAIKQAFGTSYESYDEENRFSQKSTTAPISKVWFTVAQGVLTEVFWPTIDTPQVRDSQFLVTDGESFFFEERRSSKTKVEWLKIGVPAYKITNIDPENRFSIERIIFTDPNHDALFQRIKILRYKKGLNFFILHNPEVGNTPMGNSALVNIQGAPGPGLFAWQGSEAHALISSLPFRQVSAGFSGPTDGYQDLKSDYKMDYFYKWAHNGNVVMTAWLDIPDGVDPIELDLVIGFGADKESAYEIAKTTLTDGAASLLSQYTAEWEKYQSSVNDISGESNLLQKKLFKSSIAVLKSAEDKTNEGGFVASPSTPWGEYQEDKNSNFASDGSRKNLIGGYHLVWPRDLYQIATAFMAVGDLRTAVSALRFFRRTQHDEQDGDWVYGNRRRNKNGSFPQNMWVNGESYWQGLQMDEVAMPVVLAYRLWKAQAVDWNEYWDMVRRAADFIADFGPWSPQERWEEIFGVSPSTVAAELASLWVAAEFAEKAQDWGRAQKYRNTAEAWMFKSSDNLDSWAFTKTGVHGNGQYYQRIEAANHFSQVWDPNDNLFFPIAGGGGARKEKEVTDAGFLELVRFGLKSALDWHILESLPEVDSTIRVELPDAGSGFYRYLGDRYNFDDLTGKQTAGMPWPFLTGERGVYEMTKAIEEHKSKDDIEKAYLPYLTAMEKMATPSFMFPEQVWDSDSLVGKPTGAATPLIWTHAEYLKFLRSVKDKAAYDNLTSIHEPFKTIWWRD